MKRQGFTLIEMLVVIAIIGICVSLTIPYFVEAQRGAALRTSAQTIIQTAKYARSMALLKQVDFALLVDKGASQVELVALTQPPGSGDQDKFIDERSSRASQIDMLTASKAEATDPDATNAPPPIAIKTELVRDLEDGILIKDLKVEGDTGRDRDVSWIFFNRSGTCSGFTLTIEDSRGSTADIEMDGISGLVKSKMTGRDGR